MKVGNIYKVISLSTNSLILKTQYKFNIHIRQDVFKGIEYNKLDYRSPEVKNLFF